MRYDRNEYKLHGYTRGQLNTRHKKEWRRNTNWPAGRVLKYAAWILLAAVIYSTGAEIYHHVSKIIETVPSQLQLSTHSSSVRG